MEHIIEAIAAQPCSQPTDACPEDRRVQGHLCHRSETRPLAVQLDLVYNTIDRF
jgi:hypothetical protein